MGLVRGFVFFLLLLAGIGFAILNDQAVSLKYYFGWTSPSLPLFLWAFLFLLVGLILSWLWSSLSKLALRSRVRQMKKIVIELEEKKDRRKMERRPV